MQERNVCSQGKYNKGIRKKKLKIHEREKSSVLVPYL